MLSHVFRGKFHEAVKRAFHDGKLNFHGDLKLLAQPKTFAAWMRPLLRNDWVVKLLAEAGINVPRAIDSGQLEVRRWQDAYLRRDRFDQNAMLAFIEEVLQSADTAGYPLTRVVAHME